MLDYPIFQSSSETQGQIVGRGKVGTGEKKVREKGRRALDFSSPTVLSFLGGGGYLLLGHAILSQS